MNDPRLASLRARLGTPVDNLVWKQAADMPGALDWLDRTLEPLWDDAGVERAGSAVRGACADAIDVGAGRRVALPDEARRVVAAFGRANPQNAVLVECVRGLLEQRDDDVEGATYEGAGPRLALPAADTTALPEPPAAVPPDARAAVALLQPRFGRAAAGALPGLLRHLAQWPSAVSAVADTADRRDLREALQAVHSSAVRQGAVLRTRAARSGDPAPGTAAALADLCDRFWPMITAGVVFAMIAECIDERGDGDHPAPRNVYIAGGGGSTPAGHRGSPAAR